MLRTEAPFYTSVLAVAIPALLRCSGGGDMLYAAWSLSLFAVSYLFYCTCFFFAPSTPLVNIFITLFYVGLLAFFARSLLSHVLGMVIMYLDSVLAAGLFGTVLAQHRQSDGTETAAIVAAANARAMHKKPGSRWGAYGMLEFIALCYVPRLVWLMLADSTAADVAVSLLGAIGFLQVIHISFVRGWLSIGDSVPVLLYFAHVAWLFIASHLIWGETVGVTVVWLCILASTAYLGYYHQVHASYEEIMSRSEPAADTEVPPLEEILVV